MKFVNALLQHPLTIPVLMLLTFLALLLYLEKRRKPEEDADPREEKTHHQKAASLHEGDNYPSDGEHRAAEQAYWRWQMDVEKRRDRIAIVTLSLSIFAVVAAGLSFWEIRVQASAAQGQINAMRDAQRAWLKLSSIRGTSAKRDQGVDVVSFGFKPTYKNVGQTLAQNVEFHPHVFVMGVAPSPIETCDADKPDYLDESGEIVFPQDEPPGYKTTVQIPINELSAQAARLHATQPAAPIVLGVIGCTLYTFAGSDDVHVVGFLGLVYQTAPAHDRRSLYDIISSGNGPTEVKITVDHFELWAD